MPQADEGRAGGRAGGRSWLADCAQIPSILCSGALLTCLGCWAKFPSSEARTPGTTAKSNFLVELEVPGWKSRTCPRRETQNKRKLFLKNHILPAFHTPSADWRCRLVISPFSAIFINTISGLLVDRCLRYRPSRFTRRAIAKTPVD